VGVVDAGHETKHRWRRLLVLAVPDRLFAPQGSFLNEPRMEGADELARRRSILGFGFLAVNFLLYRWQNVPDPSTNGRISTFLAEDWIGGIGESMRWVLGAAALVAGALVWATRPDKRRATLRAMMTPLITMLWFGVFLAGAALIAFVIFPPLVDYVDRNDTPGSVGHVALLLAVFALTVVLGVFDVAWMLRAAWHVVTGLFRAEDGHPLLGIIAVPLGTISLAASKVVGHHSDYPRSVTIEMAVAAAVSLTALSIYSAVLLRRQYRAEFPFLNGPAEGKRADAQA
jgi:hypothetical protein